VTQFGIDQKVIIVRDITERQRVEKMRQNFIADVSHELRTPLTVISGYLEMLGDADVNPGIMRAIKQMTEQGERMKSLVNDLLHLSKLESNNAGIGSVWFEFQPMCAVIVDQLKAYVPISLSGEKLPAAEIHCDCHSDIEIFGFSDELNSIFSNLITNAIKYGRKEGQAPQVNISIRDTQHGIEFAIADKGDGIAPSHLAHLTVRFYRVDESRESTVGGSGLGLAIVRHALEHHDAQLKIESTLGQGSRFSFVIPAERIRHKQD
jgi:two-component system phosphate regulon sensor histidine kinase PhoR